MAKATVRLTVYLLKGNPQNAFEFLREENMRYRIAVSPEMGLTGNLYIPEQAKESPSWMEFIAEGLEGELPRLNNMSSSAVLLVRHGRNWFAIPFGHGRHLIEPDRIVRGFGLRVVLNAIDPVGLSSVDANTLEMNSLRMKKQVAEKSPLNRFDHDRVRDILRGVSGAPADASLAMRMHGADSLILTKEMDFSDLSGILGRLIPIYQSKRYRTDFGFVDYMSQISDPGLLNTLDECLVRDLGLSRGGRVLLSPPDILPDEAQLFQFSNHVEGDQFLDELSIGVFIKNAGAKQTTISVDYLKRAVVRALNADREILAIWSVYDCLLLETRLNGENYLLNGGNWYCISRNFIDLVESDFMKIPRCKLRFPKYYGGFEETFNRKAAKTLKACLLDRKLIRVAGRGPIEACDILTRRGEFIHIKREMHSSLLSHLFRQGVNSADLFAHSEEYRKALFSVVKKAAGPAKSKYRWVLDNFQSDAIEVVFGVLCVKPRALKSMPFFSKLSIRNDAARLAQMHVRCSMAVISR